MSSATAVGTLAICENESFTSMSDLSNRKDNEEGFDTTPFEYCSLLKSRTCLEFPIACWRRNIPFFSSIDESDHMTSHWDDLLLRYYTPPQVSTDSNNIELSPPKRKKRVKEPLLSFDSQDEETELIICQLNEEDLFSERNSKKTKRLHTCSIE